MIVKESNKNKIEKMIKEAEGRATTRTITYNNIVIALKCIENKLNIYKKDMVGIIASVDLNAQNFPNAYKYTPKSTHFNVIRKANGWDLRWIERDITRREGHTYELELPEHSKVAIIETMNHF